jgi:hypothetical protein
MRLNRTCLRCGTAFTVPAAWVRRGGGKYCKRACADAAGRPRVVLAEHFWTRLDKNGPVHPYRPELGRCWEFVGSRKSAEFPYGQIGVNGRPRGAHRVAWELTNGPIPPGLSVLHSCDNPPCCNPAHLFLGTDAVNAWDKVAKGRAPTGDAHPNRMHPERMSRGDAHYTRRRPDWVRRKVPVAQHPVIVWRYVFGGVTQLALAAEYGVTPTRISQIIKAAHRS